MSKHVTTGICAWLFGALAAGCTNGAGLAFHDTEEAALAAARQKNQHVLVLVEMSRKAHEAKCWRTFREEVLGHGAPAGFVNEHFASVVVDLQKVAAGQERLAPTCKLRGSLRVPTFCVYSAGGKWVLMYEGPAPAEPILAKLEGLFGDAQSAETHPAAARRATSSAEPGQTPMPEGQPQKDVTGKLIRIATEGTGREQLRLLRNTVVNVLADRYRAKAASHAGVQWTGGGLDAFWSWFQAQEELYPNLLLAIHPRDDVPRVFAVVDRLRTKFPRDVARWPHLVIAYAVVWDAESAPQATRDAVIWGQHETNAVEPASLETSFRQLAASEELLTFRPHELRWPFLVYVADNDCEISERQWALRRFRDHRSNLGPVYSKVPYDDAKRNGEPACIGQHPTTLRNLLQYGGVCAERAYFASRVCKTFGVPAAAVSGVNRFGTRHVWVGYFGVTTAAGRPRPAFKFYGRYRNDHYYTGKVMDPQTLTFISDRDLALLFDASAEYARYEWARLLWRIARWIDPDDPRLATRLLYRAVDTNCYYGPAWRSIGKRVKMDRIPPSRARQLLKIMLTRMSGHPDLTLELLEAFLGTIPESDVDTRNSYYERAYRLYGERPDLQARLRLAQGQYLMTHGRPKAALRVMGTTALANVKEAIHILPLASGVLDIYRENRWYERGMRFGEALLSRMPKSRHGRPSPTYVRFCRALGEFCDDAGHSARAAHWRAQADRLEPNP